MLARLNGVLVSEEGAFTCIALALLAHVVYLGMVRSAYFYCGNLYPSTIPFLPLPQVSAGSQYESFLAFAPILLAGLSFFSILSWSSRYYLWHKAEGHAAGPASPGPSATATVRPVSVVTPTTDDRILIESIDSDDSSRSDDETTSRSGPAGQAGDDGTTGTRTPWADAVPAADSYYSTDTTDGDDEDHEVSKAAHGSAAVDDDIVEDDVDEDVDDEASLLADDALTSRRHARSPFGRSSKDRSQESVLRRSRPTAYGSVKLPAAHGPSSRNRRFRPQGPPYGPVPLEVTPTLRVVLYTAVAVGMGVYVHGNDFAVLLAIVGISFGITRGLGSSPWSPRLHWAFVMVLLIASADNQAPLNVAQKWTLRGHGWGLDVVGLPGVFPWAYIFRMFFLRLVSYNMDAYLALNRVEHTRRASASDYLVRQESSLPLSEYRRFSLYLAYTFYAPVYATGPTLSYNAFVSQVQVPQSGGMSRSKWLQHAARVALYMVIFEVYRSLVYLGALPFPNRQLNQLAEPADYALVAFFVLVTNYMKFLIIWRFARLLSLLDGIDVPDDMVRCFMSQYTFTSFWRSWHASINVWAIRYMYIPAGGTRRKGLLLWMIFLFIGLWHSVGWDKLLWALANAVGFTTELALGQTVARLAPDRESWFIWPYVRAAAGGLCIIALMFANIFIIGYPVASRLLAGAFLQGSASVPIWAFMWFTGFCISRVADLRSAQLADLPTPPKTDSAKCFTCLA